MPRWSVISFWSPLDLGFRNLGQWLAGPHTRQIKPAPAAIARGFTYDEFRNRGGPGSILRPTTRPTSVRDCRPQPALATDITELPNIPTKPGAYALVHSVLLYRSPDQPRQTATVMFSDPSHHHAGSTVWYRGRGGGMGSSLERFPPHVRRTCGTAISLYSSGGIGGVTPRTPCRVGPFRSGRRCAPTVLTLG